jgi:RND family efflux transporter MFP subunit
MNKKKIIIGVLFVGILFFLFGRKRPSKILKTQKVEKGRIETVVSSSGSIRSETEIKVQFQSSGKLAWLGVKEGDRVKKGQALASLDKEGLRKSFEKAMNDFLTSRWDFEQKRADYKFQFDHALITDDIQRILDKTQFSLNKSVLDVEIANLAVKYAAIYSPIDGVVTDVEPPVAGVNIVYTSAYVEVVDPKKMEFEAIVDEADISSLKDGQNASIILDAFPKEEIESKIKRISFKSTPTTSGGTGFFVYLSLPENRMEKMRIGLNGDFQAITNSKDNVLTIPLDALLEEDDQNFVFKVHNQKVIKTKVEAGLRNDDFVEITSGLDEGDLVITENINSLKNGQKAVVR